MVSRGRASVWTLPPFGCTIISLYGAFRRFQGKYPFLWVHLRSQTAFPIVFTFEYLICVLVVASLNWMESAVGLKPSRWLVSMSYLRPHSQAAYCLSKWKYLHSSDDPNRSHGSILYTAKIRLAVTSTKRSYLYTYAAFWMYLVAFDLSRALTILSLDTREISN